jgi:hypothetical protein
MAVNKNYRHGQKVYVNFKGLVKEARYRGVERKRTEKFHAVEIPSLRKDHELVDDHNISTNPNDVKTSGR